jgi:hypothetical protein
LPSSPVWRWLPWRAHSEAEFRPIAPRPWRRLSRLRGALSLPRACCLRNPNPLPTTTGPV